MFEITPEYLQSCFPELTLCMSTTQISCLIEEICVFYGDFKDWCESDRKVGYRLLFAHLATLRYMPQYSGGAIKQIQSERDSITYHGSIADPFDYGATAFGRQFRDLVMRNYKGGYLAHDCQSAQCYSYL